MVPLVVGFCPPIPLPPLVLPVPVPLPPDEEPEFPELEPDPPLPPPLDWAKAATGSMMQKAQAVIRKKFFGISIS